MGPTDPWIKLDSNRDDSAMVESSQTFASTATHLQLAVPSQEDRSLLFSKLADPYAFPDLMPSEVIRQADIPGTSGTANIVALILTAGKYVHTRNPVKFKLTLYTCISLER